MSGFLIRRGASFKENPQSVSPYSADIAKYFFLFRQIKDEELEDEDYKKVQSLLEKEDILAPGQIRIRDVLKREVKITITNISSLCVKGLTR